MSGLLGRSGRVFLLFMRAMVVEQASASTSFVVCVRFVVFISLALLH